MSPIGPGPGGPSSVTRLERIIAECDRFEAAASK
jgi:hypothetical protein